LRELKRRHIGFGLCLRTHDADRTRLRAARGETGAGEEARQRVVGGKITLDAFGADTVDRFVGDDEGHAGLGGVGIEGGFEIAAWDVEIARGCGGGQNKAAGAAHCRGFYGICFGHLSPCCAGFPPANTNACQRESTAMSPCFSTWRPKTSCVRCVKSPTLRDGNVPLIVSRAIAESPMTIFSRL